MPHSNQDARFCPYCGQHVQSQARNEHGDFARATTCAAHSDLPAAEPLDDRYTLTETERRV